MRIFTVFLALSLFGCGSSDESEPIQNDPVVVIDDQDQHLDQVTVADDFDWSTSSDFTITFQLVSGLSEANGDYIHLGGKHLLQIAALDENYNLNNGFLLQGLTDVTGQLSASIKLKQTWRGIRIFSTVEGVQCTRDIMSEDITQYEQVACDIEADSDW